MLVTGQDHRLPPPLLEEQSLSPQTVSMHNSVHVDSERTDYRAQYVFIFYQETLLSLDTLGINMILDFPVSLFST